ncbi:MAG: hypothetical protein QNK20_13420, partial [Aureibaculum sp.]|nr:hypothetical protein [Aureibaculum sp.]
LTDGAMNTDGGSASISDNEGNLLFYSNGINVWGADHQIIKNGTGLYGSTTVSQAVLILPNPTKENEYYIFTNQGEEIGSLGLHYSIVKLTEKDDGNDNDDDEKLEYCNKKKTKVLICHKGKNTLCVSINALQAHLDHGDSLGSCNDENKELEYSVTSKNIPLLPNSSEKLTAVYNQTDNSYWVVSFAPSTNAFHSDTFYSFKVDSNGVNLAKESIFNFLTMDSDNPGGQMKISSDLENLGMSHNTIEFGRDGGLYGVENVFTFNFNQETGEITSKIVHSILWDHTNTLNCVSSSLGFDSVHNMLTGQFNSVKIIASAYGFEFSPDGDKFYISTNQQIEYNTNIITPNLNVLQVLYRNSQKYVLDSNLIQVLDNDGVTQVYSLQLGINGKIYATDKTGELDQISNPDELGSNIEYVSNSIDLNGKIASKGLPQLIQVNQYSSKTVVGKKSVIQGNPFGNELMIDLIKIQSVEFYNQMGVKIKSVVNDDLYNSDLFSIDTSDLTLGIYFLVIKDDQSQVWNETVFKI